MGGKGREQKGYLNSVINDLFTGWSTFDLLLLV
jgi:hypothetical protein